MMNTIELVQIKDAGKADPLGGGKTYIALRGIDLSIKRGEFISLIGYSGCGKSILLNMIVGLDLATEGKVELDGLTITRPEPDRIVVV